MLKIRKHRKRLNLGTLKLLNYRYTIKHVENNRTCKTETPTRKAQQTGPTDKTHKPKARLRSRELDGPACSRASREAWASRKHNRSSNASASSTPPHLPHAIRLLGFRLLGCLRQNQATGGHDQCNKVTRRGLCPHTASCT